MYTTLVVTHGRENAKHTVYRTLTVRPEKENFHTVRKCFTCSCAQGICHEWTFFSAHLSVLMKPVEANVNKYVCTAERKYSYVFMDTTHECNALYMYEKLCLELCR